MKVEQWPLGTDPLYWHCPTVDTDHFQYDSKGGWLNLTHYHRVLEARLRLLQSLANGRAA